MVRGIALFIVVFALVAEPVRADYAAGKTAYARGDYLTALKELKGTAESGDPKSQFLVAKMYDLGQGVRKDQGQATLLYLKAAKQGYAPAMYRIGRSMVWYLRMNTNQIEAEVVNILMQNPKFRKGEAKKVKRDVRRYISSQKILAASALVAAAEQGDEMAVMEKNEVLSNLSKKELKAAFVRARNLEDGKSWLREIME